MDQISNMECQHIYYKALVEILGRVDDFEKDSDTGEEWLHTDFRGMPQDLKNTGDNIISDDLSANKATKSESVRNDMQSHLLPVTNVQNVSSKSTLKCYSERELKYID